MRKLETILLLLLDYMKAQFNMVVAKRFGLLIH